MQEKERRAREEAERESAKEAAKRVNPTEMFRGEEQRKVYEMWDEQGIPTIMKGGQEVRLVISLFSFFFLSLQYP